jgi:iron complex transport system substrate-binding protein
MLAIVDYGVGNLFSLRSSLEALGIDALLVNPEDEAGLREMISLIASAMNCGKRANELLSFMDKTEDDLASRLCGVDAPKVYLAGNSDFLSTAGDGMYQSSLISRAGGVNAAAEITDTYWANVSYEQILAWNPDYIILASDASYTVDDVLADANLAGVSAIANGNVYQMPGDAEAWDSPVPSAVLGSVWLAGVLHPDKMTDADVMATADSFYETFYGFTYREN